MYVKYIYMLKSYRRNDGFGAGRVFRFTPVSLCYSELLRVHLYPLVGEVVLFLSLVPMSESLSLVVFAHLLVHLLYCFVELRHTFSLGLSFSAILTWMERMLKLERVEARILQDRLQWFD